MIDVKQIHLPLIRFQPLLPVVDSRLDIPFNNMEISDAKILNYCEEHSSEESDALKALNRFTHANVLQSRMLSGHLQGRVLSMISHMIKPNYVLEIGTYTGYSAICLAEGLSEKGKLITIDINPELEDVIVSHIEKAGFARKIQFIVGDAYQIIRTLPYEYDLVFIDADKLSYAKYYNQVLEKLKPGGFILVDNVLWSGKVVDEKELAKDKDTISLHAFNEMVMNDSRVEKVLIPIRDGLYLIRKKA
jgi:predicted O-methyltransferase YrrM